jgi:SAM-dependent methyltransferase
MSELVLTKIPLDEVKFHPHSFGDPQVRLFRWQGQLYRGIGPKAVPFFLRLFDDGIVQHLTEQGLLIESAIAPLDIEQYEMVVHHRTLPFASYPNEWCGAMFKDAALTIINLAIALAPYGLTLGDAHPWNVLFDLGTNKPVFVDLGSIVPIGSATWSVYDEFCRYCLYPLQLMAQGQDQIARLLLCEDDGVLRSDLLRLSRSLSKENLPLVSRVESILRQLLPQSTLQQLKKCLSRGTSSSGDVLEKMRHSSHLRFLENIKREVEQISFPSFKGVDESSDILHYPTPALPYALWAASQRVRGGSKSYPYSSPLCLTTGYAKGKGGLRGVVQGVEQKSSEINYGITPISLSPQEDWTPKHQNFYRVMAALNPASVLDIGCGKGWYSKVAAIAGRNVIAFDTTPAHITQLYLESCHEQLPILPLLMDFTKSTPSRGLGDHWAIAATQRFPCDLVLALGVIHTFVLERRLNFSQIVEGLDLFSKHWVLVEFIPREDPDVMDRWTDRIAWYTLDNFIDALKQKFQSVNIMPSHPNPRVLLLCEK